MCLALPGNIVEITDEGEFLRSGKVSFDSVAVEVNLAFVPEARVGDYVLVHAGFAISVIDEAEAERALAYIDEFDEKAES